jgi:hypothetical protein
MARFFAPQHRAPFAAWARGTSIAGQRRRFVGGLRIASQVVRKIQKSHGRQGRYPSSGSAFLLCRLTSPGLGARSAICRHSAARFLNRRRFCRLVGAERHGSSPGADRGAQGDAGQHPAAASTSAVASVMMSAGPGRSKVVLTNRPTYTPLAPRRRWRLQRPSSGRTGSGGLRWRS